MRLVNGMNREVNWNAKVIKNEASQDHGLTSIVIAHCNNGNDVSISQHQSFNEWDISLNEEPYESYEEEEADKAVAAFMRLVQDNNTTRR